MADQNTGPVADFCAELRSVQQQSPVDRAMLAQRLNMSRSQLYAILGGDIKRPPEWDRFVAPFLRACDVDEQAIGEWRRRHDVLVRVHDELRRRRRAATAPAVSVTSARVTAVVPPATMPPRASETVADPALEDLAGVVRRQWREELGARASQPQSIIPPRLTGAGRPAAVPVRRAGTILDLLATLPAGQLMILGGPGAGKSFAAMAVTLDLLAAREPGRPVPVLLTASSWNPLRERADTWLSRRLVTEYPWLANAGRYGADAADRLVATRHITLVMDGLDEIPAEMHRVAFKALDIYAGDETPFIVTCRTGDYDRGVERHGTVLANAAVMELVPLDPPRIREYLCAGPAAADARWAPVLRHLGTHPGGPLAQALSTPLMVDLARAAYPPVAGDPAELTATGRFPVRADIERHLVAGHASALYTVHHDRLAHRVGALPEADPRSHYRHDDAVRWLSFLARHLRRPDVAGIAWWQLRSALPRWPFQALLGLLFGTVGAVVVGLAAGAVLGSSFRPVAAAGVGLGVAFGTALLAGPRAPVPARVDPRLPLRRLVARLPWIGTVGVLSGLAFGLIFAAATGSGRDLVIGLSAGLVAGVTGAAGVNVGVALRAALDAHDDVSQASRLRSDRRAALITALVAAVLSGTTAAAAAAVMARPDRQLPVAFIAGLGVAVGAASVAVARSAWGQWQVVRLWLAATGRAPWAVLRFLDDAHRRGMLRRVGSVYEFRHRSVQDHLGDRPAGSGADPADGSRPAHP